ncbi:hypothetical protein V6N13_106434 [Hibiscus sabdariffa]
MMRVTFPKESSCFLLTHQVAETDSMLRRAQVQDLVNPRRSVSLPLPSMVGVNSFPRKSCSYSKLSEEPIKLSVRKLDGSSFDVEVIKSATIAELKLAVQHVFSHMPKKGPGMISWSISSSKGTSVGEQIVEEDDDTVDDGRCKTRNNKKQSMIAQQECQFGHLWRGWSSYSRRKGSTKDRVCKRRESPSFVGNCRKIFQLWGTAKYTPKLK